MFGAYVDSTV